MRRLAARFLSALRSPGGEQLIRANVVGAVDEFCSRLFEELDYRREARNAQRFASLYGRLTPVPVTCSAVRAASSKIDFRNQA